MSQKVIVVPIILFGLILVILGVSSPTNQNAVEVYPRTEIEDEQNEPSAGILNRVSVDPGPVTSNSLEPTFEGALHWWEDPDSLQAFYILYDQALINAKQHQDEVRRLEVEIANFDPQKFAIPFARWTNNGSKWEDWEGMFEGAPYHIYTFVLEDIKNQRDYSNRQPPIDLREPFWSGIFAEEPFWFHPRMALQFLNELEEAPTLAPDVETQVLTIQLKYMIKMAYLNGEAFPYEFALGEASRSLGEGLPLDSDLLPSEIIQFRSSASQLRRDYLGELEVLEYGGEE
jgi:hypothetical protein